MRLLKYWFPTLIWLGVIFAGSTDFLSATQTSRFLVPFLRWLIPDLSFAAIETIQLVIRKLGHLTEYAILALLFWRALRGGTNLRAKTPTLFITVWFACTLFAISDEFHQSFIASRTASPSDVMIDICGVFLGLAICWALSMRRKPPAAC